MASSAATALPQPIVHVHIVVSDNSGPHKDNAPDLWFGILNLPSYTGVLAPPAMRVVVNLSTKWLPVVRAPRAFYGPTESSSEALIRTFTDTTNDNPPLEQLTAAVEVEACVLSSNVMHFRPLVILIKANRFLQKPPPQGFPYVLNNDYMMLNMPAEDSYHNENMQGTRAGRRVGMSYANGFFP